jgi:hypothetical protein
VAKGQIHGGVARHAGQALLEVHDRFCNRVAAIKPPFRYPSPPISGPDLPGPHRVPSGGSCPITAIASITSPLCARRQSSHSFDDNLVSSTKLGWELPDWSALRVPRNDRQIGSSLSWARSMHDIERDDRLGEALEGEGADFFERCHLFHLNGDPLGNQDLPIPGLGTKAAATLHTVPIAV